MSDILNHGRTAHELALAADGGKRADFITGLRGEEIMLATHMDVPVPNLIKSSYMVLLGSDEEMIAEIDRIAAALGEEAHWSEGRYVVRHALSSRVVYEAECLPHDYPGKRDGRQAA